MSDESNSYGFVTKAGRGLPTVKEGRPAMSDFVASNGKRVETLEDGQIAIVQRIPGSPMEHRTWAGPGDTQALHEFFLAERDAELGRWRSKEHPDYVVYRAHFGCRVLHEPTANVYEYRSKDTGSDIPLTAYLVAREWFDAQEPPKPWHDAKPGEVWALELLGLEDEFLRVEYYGSRWLNARTGLVVPEAENATAGRRIWPEEQGVEL